VAEGEGPPATKQLFTALRQIAQGYIQIQSCEQVTGIRKSAFSISDLQIRSNNLIT